jgi:hypothetical protein
MASSSSFTPRRSERIANKPKVSYKEESWSYSDAFRTPVNKRTDIQKMLVNEAMENINKAQKIAYTNVLKRREEELARILKSSKKYTPCLQHGCACTSSPPPSFGSSATSSIPPITKKKEITAPSAAGAFAPAAVGVKTPSPSSVPLVPKKSSEEIVRDTMTMLNSLLPQDKIIDVLIQSIKSRGIEIPAWLEEDDDDEDYLPSDEEEFTQEEVDRLMELNGYY